MFLRLIRLCILGFLLFIFGCGDDGSSSYEDTSSGYNESADSDWEENCEEYDDCDSFEDVETPDTEGKFSLKVSDGYWGGHIEGDVSMTSVGDEKDGIKTSGILIFLNENREQSPFEMLNITLLRIGDDSGRMTTGEYKLVKVDPKDGKKQYGVFRYIINDPEQQLNTSFVNGKVVIEKVDELEYEVNDSVNMIHDVATASLNVVLHDKQKAKDIAISGSMRVVSLGKMTTN